MKISKTVENKEKLSFSDLKINICELRLILLDCITDFFVSEKAFICTQSNMKPKTCCHKMSRKFVFTLYPDLFSVGSENDI